MMLLLLDEVAGLQDLYKQDYKQLIKRAISETESKLNKINEALTDDEKTAYYELWDEKMKLYKLVDSFNTISQITLFKNFAAMQDKMIIL